ncbi:MAG: aminotransferase class V-fold PLP-dependent enzyme [Polyangiaceae bacterium]|nr:aminotransferase class V-fold PLP-dependent enzyme [Myxococcales bacterium]MCB9586336.1 aminotransferase class V-fold PLP-dependent enzyme [Polyangiaceae bacterium]MCB9607013.1 aminotransferase class V-fold PLP-dependent enzyme [Polyangiaceae bacterium]
MASFPELEGARREFPILEQRNYLASHALGPMPRSALDDLAEYRETLLLRTAGIPAQLETIEQVRGDLGRLLNTQPDNVALTASATAGLAQIALALTPTGSRRRILLSAQNFPSTRFVWEAQARRGFELVSVERGLGVGEERTPEAVAPLDERVAALVVPWVAPYSGALMNLSTLAARCREVGAILVVDAYQGLGIVPLDLSQAERSPHVVVGGNHKWLSSASMGLAFMYVDPLLARSLEPPAPGWIGEASFPAFSDQYRPAAGAKRFQQGTPAVEPMYGAMAGLRFVLRHGVDRLRRASLHLTSALYSAAESSGLPVLTPRADHARGGTVTLDLSHLEVSAQQQLLRDLATAAIDVDFRPGGGMRMSPHPCAAPNDCDAAVSTISQLLVGKYARI